jgi:hypothetical protein
MMLGKIIQEKESQLEISNEDDYDTHYLENNASKHLKAGI